MVPEERTLKEQAFVDSIERIVERSGIGVIDRESDFYGSFDLKFSFSDKTRQEHIAAEGGPFSGPAKDFPTASISRDVYFGDGPRYNITVYVRESAVLSDAGKKEYDLQCTLGSEKNGEGLWDNFRLQGEALLFLDYVSKELERREKDVGFGFLNMDTERDYRFYSGSTNFSRDEDGLVKLLQNIVLNFFTS